MCRYYGWDRANWGCWRGGSPDRSYYPILLFSTLPGSIVGCEFLGCHNAPKNEKNKKIISKRRRSPGKITNKLCARHAATSIVCGRYGAMGSHSCSCMSRCGRGMHASRPPPAGCSTHIKWAQKTSSDSDFRNSKTTTQLVDFCSTSLTLFLVKTAFVCPRTSPSR